MPRVTLTIPKVNVTLDVPADFAAYVTLNDLRQMAESIVSVEHVGLGVDTICRLRAREKAPEWCEAFVAVDEDDTPVVTIEDDGFTALESEMNAATTGTISLTVSYEKPWHDPQRVSISKSYTEEESQRIMTHCTRNLESWWQDAQRS